MFYLTSSDTKEHLVGDILIPRNRYTEEQEANGKRSVLQLTEVQVQTLMEYPAFAELVNSDIINISDKPPVGYGSTVDGLKEQLAAAHARIAELEEGIEE